MGAFALLLVREKTGLAEFAEKLSKDFGYRLYGSQEIADDLSNRGLAIEVVDSGAALDLLEGEGTAFGLVVANFFSVELVGREFMSWKKAMDAFDTDIVSVIRKAALKPARFGVIGNPKDYEETLKRLAKGGGRLPQSFTIPQATNALLAGAQFDASVAQYLEIQGADAPDIDALSGYPKSIYHAWKRSECLHSGENIHQKAAVYGTFGEHFTKLAGPALDYQSMADISTATFLIGDFERNTVALVQRTSLLFLASADTIFEAWERLDDRSFRAFRGGVCIVNASVDTDLAVALSRLPNGTIVAPRFSDDAVDILRKNESVRLLVSDEGIGYEALQEMRSVVGGVLVQDKNRIAINPMEWVIRSFSQPHVDRWQDMIFAAKAARHLRSSMCVAVIDETVVAQASALPIQDWAVDQVLDSLQSVDVSQCVIALDEKVENPEILVKIKKCGVNILLHPGSLDPSQDLELSAVANELGLILLATGRSHRKF